MNVRFASWNVDKSANGNGRLDEQLAFLGRLDPDILFLQEVRQGADDQWLSQWEAGLADIGLDELVHTCDWANELGASTVPPHSDIGHDNGHVAAIRSEWSLTRRSLTIRDHIDRSERAYFDTHFPEKILVATAELQDKEIDLWNIRAVPGNGWGEEKVKIFETVYDRLCAEGERTRIVAGDFNSPARELPDGQAVPFGYDKPADFRERKVRAELNMLKGLGHLGLRDVFRTQHGYRDLAVPDTSWRNKRFDHCFASQEIGVTDCWYDHDGFECSDHAPIVADLVL